LVFTLSPARLPQARPRMMLRPRFTDWPELVGIRSFRVERPFHRLLLFYRHGSRDLPRRLREPPELD
jgi:hypothetical protein